MVTALAYELQPDLDYCKKQYNSSCNFGVLTTVVNRILFNQSLWGTEPDSNRKLNADNQLWSNPALLGKSDWGVLDHSSLPRHPPQRRGDLSWAYSN
jgi:hypothetical protein